MTHATVIPITTTTRNTSTTNDRELCACCRLSDLARSLHASVADDPVLVDAAIVWDAIREVVVAAQSLHEARSRT